MFRLFRRQSSGPRHEAVRETVPVPPLTGGYSEFTSFVPRISGTHTSRIFLPLGRDSVGAEQRSWRYAAAQRGIPLLPDTTFYDLVDETPENSPSHPFAGADRTTIAALLAAVRPSIRPDEEVYLALWKGYAGDHVDGDVVNLEVEQLGTWQVHNDLRVVRSPLAGLLQLADQRWPVFLWTADLRLVVSCPLYSDSVFVTSDVIDSGELAAQGLEALPADLDGPITFTGD